MPRGIFNWTYRDIEGFLRENRFSLIRIEGSHHHFHRVHGGRPYLVQVQFHGSNISIAPRTMKSIITQSGIAQSEWRQWAES